MFKTILLIEIENINYFKILFKLISVTFSEYRNVINSHFPFTVLSTQSMNSNAGNNNGHPPNNPPPPVHTNGPRPPVERNPITWPNNTITIRERGESVTVTYRVEHGNLQDIRVRPIFPRPPHPRQDR